MADRELAAGAGDMRGVYSPFLTGPGGSCNTTPLLVLYAGNHFEPLVPNDSPGPDPTAWPACDVYDPLALPLRYWSPDLPPALEARHPLDEALLRAERDENGRWLGAFFFNPI